MRNTIIHILLTTILCALLIETVTGQTGPIPTAQQQMAKSELSSQGVDESTLRSRLLDKGIDIDKMSPEELLGARPQIEATVKEIKAEVAALEVVEEGLDEAKDVKELVEEGASVSEAKAEAEVAADLGAQPKTVSNIYGHQIFQNKTLEVYRATDRATAPATYVLDSGDELAISIFGASQTDLLLEINEDGFIKPSGIPKIYLRGRTLSEARDLVRSRMSNYYVFGSGQFSLSIDAARTISVSIYGEVQQSGTYTLSALNGPLNALIAAGGPTERGSVRNIELIREGKKTTIDVYEFLQNPGSATKMELRDKDILNIPLATNLISISGGVRRPMAYELRSNESLGKLVEYAGGTTTRAAVNTTRVERYKDGITKIVDVDGRNFAQFSLQNGDRVEIPIVTEPIEDYVTIIGEVLVDGKYGFRQNLRLSQVVDRAGLKPSARTDVAFIKRKNNDGTGRLERVSIEEGSNDLQKELKRGDVITVLASARFINNANFTVSGAVRDVDITLPYPSDGKLSLEEAILLGGGLKENAVAEALVIRTPVSNVEKSSYLRVNLSEAKTFIIEPYDKVIIYSQERFSDNPTVSISGAVRNPSSTTYDASLSINDLLYIAGGLRYDAANDRVEVYRLSLDDNETKILVETLSIDDEGQIIGNFNLKPFDQVNVRSIAEFSPIESISITGEVSYPGSYARLKGKNRISDLIERCGGLTLDAFPDGATLIRNEKKIIIELEKILSDPLSPGNIVLRSGDKIVVPKPRETVVISTKNTYSSRFGTEALTTEEKIEVAFQGEKRANWYVNNYAGGLTKNAEKKAITVTGAAGDIQETKRFLWIKGYPKVEAGSTVYIPTKPPKKEKPIRENTSWSEIAQVIVAAMTTVATLIIISERNTE